MRGIDFIYNEPGVNKPLTPEDDEKKNLNHTKYRIQVNKTANAIKELINFPFKFRQSKYYNDENARDLIFKGYTIPYYIDLKNNTIVILTIFKYNLP